jgi:hypothetical protein
VGILLMPEVIFGAGTAAIFAGETLSPSEMIGCGLGSRPIKLLETAMLA